MPDDPTPTDDLPKAPPLSKGRAPLLDRLLGRPWPRVDVLLLKTDACPLCDVARALLEKRRSRLGISLRLLDITNQPDLLATYGGEVPVVFVAGRKRFFGQLDEVLLAREVRAARG